ESVRRKLDVPLRDAVSHTGALGAQIPSINLSLIRFYRSRRRRARGVYPAATVQNRKTLFPGRPVARCMDLRGTYRSRETRCTHPKDYQRLLFSSRRDFQGIRRETLRIEAHRNRTDADHCEILAQFVVWQVRSTPGNEVI